MTMSCDPVQTLFLLRYQIHAAYSRTIKYHLTITTKGQCQAERGYHLLRAIKTKRHVLADGSHDVWYGCADLTYNIRSATLVKDFQIKPAVE